VRRVLKHKEKLVRKLLPNFSRRILKLNHRGSNRDMLNALDNSCYGWLRGFKRIENEIPASLKYSLKLLFSI
jgi:hypothetical protein